MKDSSFYKIQVKDSCLESRLRFDVTLALSKSAIVLLQGNNGLGKSTLIRLIKKNQHKYGLVNEANFIDQSKLDVLDDLSLSDITNLMKKRLFRASSNYFQDLFEQFKAENFWQQACYELSGGQKQMTKILIGTYFEADVYFFDEPFQNLDHENSKVFQNFLQKLVDDQKKVLVVEHNTTYIPEAVTVSRIMNQEGVITNAL